MIGALAILVVAAPATAQKEDVTEHVSVELDADVLTDYDDSGLWVNGLGGGVTGLWALSASTFACARFGLVHWSYDEELVVPEVVPPGALITAQQSTGQLEILSLTPMIRYQREEVLPADLGAFAEGGAGIAYVKTFALTEVRYDTATVEGQVARFEINEVDVFADVIVAAGVTRAVSSSSWVEIISSYHAIFADETSHVFGIGVGFRVRV
jgi:hypothetical protein